MKKQECNFVKEKIFLKNVKQSLTPRCQWHRFVWLRGIIYNTEAEFSNTAVEYLREIEIIFEKL